MVIKYKLSFYGEDDDYAYLISKILEKTDSNVIRAGSEIIIYMQGDEEGIKASFGLLGERLPISLYLGEQSVEEAAMMPPNRQELKKASYLAMYPSLARELIDESSPSYFAVNGGVSVDGELAPDETRLQNALKELVQKLKNGKKIAIQNEYSEYAVRLAPTNAVLLSNLTSKNLEFFGISVDEAITLSAMERPFVIKQDGEGQKLFCFANDELLLLLSKVATDEGVDALYIDTPQNADAKLHYEAIKGDAPSRKALFFSGQDRFFLNDEFTPNGVEGDGALFFDINIGKDFGVYAIKEKGVSKKIVGASFFDGNPLVGIGAEFDFGAKLAQNFENSFATEAAALKSFVSENEPIKDFFAALSILFGSNGGFAHVAALADDADIAGGVKLDFVLQKTDEGVALDLKKCFASILSYKLAGVENNILAYSVFESAVDFLIVAQDEAKKSFEIKRLFVGGEFLLSKVFVSKLKSKIKNVDIDMALNSLPSNLQGLYEIAR